MKNSNGQLVVLAAGGTGGHLFPAQALAETLVKRGFRTQLMTDERVRDYGKSFPAEKTHVVHSASPSLSDPIGLPKRLWKLFSGYRAAKNILRVEKPVAVIGFGGYPSFPPIYAAAALGIPSAVHEQNAVLGRANKMLSKKVNAVAASFGSMIGLPDEERGMVVKAFVVLKPAHEANEATIKLLQDHVKAVLAPFKYPRQIEFVANLPHTETGKLQRFRLRNLSTNLATNQVATK